MDIIAKTSMFSDDSIAPLSISGDRLSHAYIVSVGLADTLAMSAVCSGSGGDKPCKMCKNCNKASRRIHPDIKRVEKPQDKREIVVDQIRELKKDVIVVPNEAEKKVYIVDSADLMNRSAQNAFLKMLEEPPANIVFILETDNPAALLPTVRSRCVELTARFEPESPDSVAEEMANEFFSAIEQGNAALTTFMFRLEKLEKEAFAGFLPAARALAATKLRSDVPGHSRTTLETVAHAESLLVKAGVMLDMNVGLGHISGMICASLIEIEERK